MTNTNNPTNKFCIYEQAHTQGNDAVAKMTVVSLVWALTGCSQDTKSDKYAQEKSKIHINLKPFQES